MASTWSALKIELLETGANAGSWGTLTNVNLGDAVLGEAITGQATVDFASDADVTITLTDSATTQAARNLRLNITESSAGVGSVRNLILGSGCQIEKFYLINNTGTGAKTIKNTSGTGISVPAGKATLVYNNGTNVVDAASYFTSLTLGSALPITSGGTGTTSTTFANLASNVTGTLPVVNGGTGLATLTANNVLLGNGTSTPLFVAPGTNGNVLTSNGSTWSSTAPAAGTTFSGGTTGFTPSTATSGAVTLAGTLAVANGGTGQTSYTNGQLLIGNTTGNTLTKATLTQGTGITITNSTGSITVANSGVTSVGGTGTVNGLSLSGTVTTTGNLTLGGTLSSVANSALTNSSVTVTAGTGMSGGGAVALGSSVTLTNAGVTSITAGTGISVSAATGGVTVSATGGSPAMVKISATTISSATATVQFSVDANSVYAYYMLSMYKASVTGSTNRTGRFRVSRDGTNFLSDNAYLQTFDNYDTSGYMGVFDRTSASEGQGQQSIVYIYVANTGIFSAMSAINGRRPSESSTTAAWGTPSSWQGGGANIVAFQLYPETGTISGGTYTLYGVVK